MEPGLVESATAHFDEYYELYDKDRNLLGDYYYVSYENLTCTWKLWTNN